MRLKLALRGGIRPENILPHLPKQDCFFDCRHWVVGTTDDVLPFAVTTRIGANNQQWLKLTIER